MQLCHIASMLALLFVAGGLPVMRAYTCAFLRLQNYHVIDLVGEGSFGKVGVSQVHCRSGWLRELGGGHVALAASQADKPTPSAVCLLFKMPCTLGAICC